MSTPLTSPAPDGPSGSSNPVPLRSWFKKIADWIAGLSPAGAAAYDTNWIDVPLVSGYTFNAQPQVRRIGMTVHWRGDVQGPFTTSYTTVAAAANLPAWAIVPRSYRDGVRPLAGNNAVISASGLIDAGNGLRITTNSALTTAINLGNLSGYLVN